jgi:D-alanine-D-alanine ligase
MAAIARHARPGGAVLVLGCGAGGEVVHLARAGYQVTGVDAVPEMIEAAGQLAAEAGITARLEVMDLREFDARGRRYHAVYLTPLLYSFIAGRQRRVTLLRRLGAHLEPDGCVLFSAHLHRGAWSWLQTRLAAWRRGRTAWRGEPGDWYTWYLTPRGTIGRSYLRRFSAGEVVAETRAAGYTSIARLGSHFLATDPGPG